MAVRLTGACMTGCTGACRAGPAAFPDSYAWKRARPTGPDLSRLENSADFSQSDWGCGAGASTRGSTPGLRDFMSDSARVKKLAILVGGGPAPGINGVISAATIEAINNNFEVLGIQDGYKWLVKGRADKARKLSISEVSQIYNKGGSILGTSRTNPAKNEKDLERVIETFQKLGVTHLVSIGGDDTAYSASKVYQRAGKQLRVAHVPKTIDNDVPLPGSTPTFGFETARQIGTAIVENLAEDAKTTSRWYVAVSMGRAAGHLALGIGKAAAAHLTIIPEEFDHRPLRDEDGGRVSFDEIVDIIIGSILKRRSMDKEYGIVVLAEGLIEAISSKNLVPAMNELATALGHRDAARYGDLQLDDHGHLRLGEVEFARMVVDALKLRGPKFEVYTTFIDKDLGYELRCADPIPFDIEYTRDLGYSAVKFLTSDAAGEDGALITFIGGSMVPRMFGDLFGERERLPTRKVNVAGETYEVARGYMFRLEREDFEEPSRLAKLAAGAGLSPENLRNRLGYLVGI
jgi:6-phosphofructokinase 1